VDRQFFASTRGRIVMLLRRASRTVDELATSLDLTDNAVRAQIATLERDGLVEQRGSRRGVSKPAAAYGLADGAEWLFPKAYGAVLAQLLAVLRERLQADELESVLRAVGRRIAALHPVVTADSDARLARAADVLNGLGGLAEIERDGGAFIIRGYDCPFAALATHHPDVCSVAEAMLADLIGVPVRERCDRGVRPHCRFEGTLANEPGVSA
jgi:predicted ArsR family transcriptional regulator